LSNFSTVLISALLTSLKSVPFGKNHLIKPLTS